jgi:hypothetical protein
MCPGGIEIGSIDFRQAAEQFDFEAARRFRSRAEADRVCIGRTGFLLEIQRGPGCADVARGDLLLFVETSRG